jgi:hypothetical protein
VLQKVRAQFQIPLKDMFDKEVIMWEKKINYIRCGKNKVLHVVTTQNKLKDFVERESNCQDFPYYFMWKKQKVVQSRSQTIIQISSYTQHIK